MKIRISIFICLVFILSACRPASMTPAATTPSTGEVSATQSTAGTEQNEITIPVMAGEAVPWPVQPISRGNVAYVEPLARWGKGTIHSIEWSPDGTLIAVGASLGIYLYDATSFQEIRWFARDIAIYELAFSPDGTMLASSFNGGTIKLWDIASGEEIRSLNYQAQFASRLSFSADGKILVSSEYQNLASIWDVASGLLLTTLPDTQNGCDMAFSPDGKTMACGIGYGAIAIWDVASLEQIRTLEGHTDYVRKVTFSPDGTKLLSVSSDASIKLWDLAAGKELWTLPPVKESWADTFGFLPDGNILAMTGFVGPIKVLDSTNGQEIRTFIDGEFGVDLSFSPDNKKYAILNPGSSSLQVWDYEKGKTLGSLDGYNGPVGPITGVAFSPDGKYLAFMSGTSWIKLWEAASGKEIRTFVNGTKNLVMSFESLTFSPDGALIASGTGENTIKVWDVASGGELFILEGQNCRITAIEFSPDGSILAAGKDDNTVELWDAVAGIELNTLGERGYCGGFSDNVQGLAFSPDSQILAVSHTYDPIDLWDPNSGQLIHRITDRQLTSSDSSRNALAFSPDGSLLASRAVDSIALWDVASWQEIITLEGHSDEVTSLAFSPDGRLLASGSWDSTVKLWDLTSGMELKSLELQFPIISSLSISPDGRVLATGSWDGTITLWGIPPWVTVPEDTTEDEILIPTLKPTVQPTPEELGIEKTPISILSPASRLDWTGWSPDGKYFVYRQHSLANGDNSDQAFLSLRFLRSDTGEICPGPQETISLESSPYADVMSQSDLALSERFSWMSDGRLLYIDPEGGLQAITPCSDSVENWTGYIPDRLISISKKINNVKTQVILRGVQGYWLFTPGTKQTVHLDLPVSLLDVPIMFSWSPWEPKIAAGFLTRHDNKIWSTVTEIDATTGAVGLIAEFPTIEEYNNPSAGWIAKGQIILDIFENGVVIEKIIDTQSEPIEIIDVFPQLFGIENPSMGLMAWGKQGGTGGQDYHLIYATWPTQDGTFLLYHAESGQVEQIPFDPPNLLIWPDGETVYIIQDDQPAAGPETYQVRYLDSDAVSADLVLKGHSQREPRSLYAQMIPGTQQILFTSSRGISLVDLQSGELLRFWEMEEPEQYQEIYTTLGPDNKTIVGLAVHEGTPTTNSMQVLFWLRIE